MKRERKNAKDITQIALFAAILCIFSPITIFIGQIPVTLSVFAVMLTGIVLSGKKALGAVLVYILLGLCGLPVFSGAQGGAGVLFGPTGGYIWSYSLMVLLISLKDKFNFKKLPKTANTFIYCILSLLLCYILGTTQFVIFSKCNIDEALAVCVYPFIIFDVLKSLLSSLLGEKIKKRLTVTH